jgi:hypothetical protein
MKRRGRVQVGGECERRVKDPQLLEAKTRVV